MEKIQTVNVEKTDEDIARELEKQINGDLSNEFISNDEAIARELQGEIDSQEESFNDNISYEKCKKNDEDIARELEKEMNDGNHLSNAFISNDEAIARELQGQIDREYNENLKRLEKLQNGTSKLNISYEKYRKYENYDGYGEEDFDEFDPPDNVDWDRFEAVDRTFNSIPPCGYLFNKDGSVVTKHDVSLNGQRNMKKLMSLPPNVQTGDGAASHMEISNSVLNGLKRHSQNETHRENMRRKEKEETKDRKLGKVKNPILSGVDQSTNDTVHSLLKGLNPCLKQINGRIGEGKESLIYWGEKSPPEPFYHHQQNERFDCIIKMYKLDVHDFKHQEKYIADDYRYKDRYNSKMHKFNIMCLWAEKERDNLARLKKYILCPEPIMLKNNVLVMSLIGKIGKPARKLKHAEMTMREYQSAYEQIIENMKIMYNDARLVHADLSEYNILWHKNKCYIIDVSQAVDVAHVNAFEYLKRDCKNVIEFFDRKQLDDIMTKEELFKYICNQDYNDKIGLELLSMELKEKRQPKPHDDHKFEELWERSKSVKVASV